MKNILKNERGNIAIFVLGLLTINMVLFVFVLNLGSVFATKEKSSTIAQQASMVATSVYYEEVQRVIEEYEDETLEGALQAFFEDFDEKVSDRKQSLTNSGQYSGWSVKEIEIEAFDQVLNEELHEPLVRNKLRDLLSSEAVENKVIQRVRHAITSNGGLLEDAQLKVDQNKFHVKASNEFKSTTLEGVIDSFKENVFQSSSGPKIDFLEEVWTGSTTIDLE
ncbi:Tad domain-containing protein [Piscibacillus halophilus]|uniref:Flp pilus-assembly TadE/G-like n=1 Tax=Piscibacillus halophilus TaxID=571933 RepID=A0A1H9C9U6_9BACI|nr:Tad domain-containing protein [Piscibacillus halophilus]SEP97924.1 hypothetical protein SAMN05216362_1055 [Piscibacillus halophilus]